MSVYTACGCACTTSAHMLHRMYMYVLMYEHACQRSSLRQPSEAVASAPGVFDGFWPRPGPPKLPATSETINNKSVLDEHPRSVNLAASRDNAPHLAFSTFLTIPEQPPGNLKKMSNMPEKNPDDFLQRSAGNFNTPHSNSCNSSFFTPGVVFDRGLPGSVDENDEKRHYQRAFQSEVDFLMRFQ